MVPKTPFKVTSQMPGELAVLMTRELPIKNGCRMVRRESKDTGSIKNKIVNRKLHGRRIYRRESQKSRVRSNLRVNIFAELGCVIIFVEKKWILGLKKVL